MITCTKCKLSKTEDNYYLWEKRGKKTRSGKCKSCWSVYNKEKRISNLEKYRQSGAKSMRNRSQEKKLLDHARERARAENLPFSITEEDIKIPEYCPILGTILIRNLSTPSPENSPSLDKIIPELGYVPGNIWVISYRANRIKDNASLLELKKLVVALECQLLNRNS